MSESNVFYNLKLKDNVLKGAQVNTTEVVDSLHGDEVQLQAFMDKYGFFASMITAKGEIRTFIGQTEKERLGSLANRFDRLKDEDKEVLNVMKKEISRLVKTALKLTEEEAAKFQAYFEQLVTMELLENHLYSRASYTIKEGKSLDYKISRVARYLGIQLDPSAIADFEISYDASSIKLNGQEHYKRPAEEIPKAKRFGMIWH